MLVEIIHVGTACKVLPAHFVLHDDFVLVGRSPSCQLIIADNSVSRKHAEIRRDIDHIVLTDLQSKNGTYLNEQRIAKAEVGRGVRMRFGRVGFIVKLLASSDRPCQADEDTGIWSRETMSIPRMDNILRLLQTALSASELRVFHHLTGGESEKEMARKLCLSRHTVHQHIQKIYAKLGVHSRPELFHRLIAAKHWQLFDGEGPAQ